MCTVKNLQHLEPHAREKLCVWMRARWVHWLHLQSLARGIAISCKRTPCKKWISVATKLPRTKKKVNLTKVANSMVAILLHKVLRMAFVESGNSADSEDCLVDQLAVANSWWSSRLPGGRQFCPSVIQVPGRWQTISSYSRILFFLFW